MPPKFSQLLAFDPSELEDTDKLLHLTLHRNKNQHRLAKWWKSFQILKRNISKILIDLDIHKRTQTKVSRTAVEDRVSFMLEFLMPKCYRSFGALIADNQFAALGLMLMGTLARISKIVIPLQKKVEAVIATTVKEKDSTAGDIGEIVMRPIREKLPLQLDTKVHQQLEMEQGKSEKRSKKTAKSSSTLPSTDDMPLKPPKKKRKKGNAIDDLFSNIL